MNDTNQEETITSTTPHPGRRLDWIELSIVGIVVCGWLVCWLYAFHSFPGLNADEAYNVLVWELWSSGEIPALRFPSGRYPHFLLSGLMALSHQLFGPTLWGLRLPVLLTSLVSAVCLFLVGKRQWDWRRGLVFALLIVVHPVFLGYSRFAWESSTAWLALSMVYLPLAFVPRHQRRPIHHWCIGVGVVLVLLAHPVYLIALLAALYVEIWRAAAGWQRGPLLRKVMAASVLVAVSGWSLYLGIKLDVAAAPTIALSYLSKIWENISGVRIYQYITGATWGTWFLVQSAATLLALLFVLWQTRQTQHPALRWLSGVLGLCLIGLLLTQPFLPLSVGFGRYSLHLIFALSLLLATGVTLAKQESRILLFALYATCCLSSYAALYFGHGFATQNRATHFTFWSGSHPGDPEPKRKTSQWLETHLPSHTTVWSRSFFFQYALRYYLGRPTKRWGTPKTPGFPRLSQASSWAFVELPYRQTFRLIKEALTRQQMHFCLHLIKTANQRLQFLVFYSPASAPRQRCRPGDQYQ